MKSTKKETLKMVILFPVISGHGHFRSFSFSTSVIFIVYYFFRSFPLEINEVFLSYWLIIRIFYLNLQKICCTQHHIDEEFWNNKGTYNDRYKTENFQKCGYTPEFH